MWKTGGEHLTVLPITWFSYVIFDLDGTLVDNMRFYNKIFAEISASLGISCAEARLFFTQTAGTPLAEQFRMLLSSKKIACEKKMIDALCSQFRQRCDGHNSKLFPGARKLLRSLASRGVTVMISNGSPDDLIEERLAKAGVASSVALFCGSTVIPKGPAHIEHLAGKLSIKTKDLANNGCFCGDGETDMRIAAATGLYPIGVAGTVSAERLYVAGAKRVVAKVSDLLRDLAK